METALARGLLLLLAMMLAGCARAAAPRPFPPPAGEADISRLTHAMVERDRALQSLSTGALMEYSGGGHDHIKAHEQIIARRPASLRIEAMSPFGVALVVAANGDKLRIFDPSKNVLMSGAANAATLARFTRIPMEPRDAVALLMGTVPAVQDLEPDAVVSPGGQIVLTYGGQGRPTRELEFANGELVTVSERGPNGVLGYEVHYSDYRDIGGVMLAYQVEADFPTAGSHLKLSYERPIINSHFPDSVFVLTPGPGAKLVELGMWRGVNVGREG